MWCGWQFPLRYFIFWWNFNSIFHIFPLQLMKLLSIFINAHTHVIRIWYGYWLNQNGQTIFPVFFFFHFNAAPRHCQAHLAVNLPNWIESIQLKLNFLLNWFSIDDAVDVHRYRIGICTWLNTHTHTHFDLCVILLKWIISCRFFPWKMVFFLNWMLKLISIERFEIDFNQSKCVKIRRFFFFF